MFKTPSVKYGSDVSCVFNQIAYLCFHFAVALVFTSIKRYVWQETFKQAVNFQSLSKMHTNADINNRRC